MNFGKIAKVFAFNNGFSREMEASDGEDIEEAGEKALAPGKLAKANAALEKLKEQMERKWKIDE